MATVTGKTSSAMQAIADASIVSGTVDGSGHLILTTHSGINIDAGLVKGATGASGNALSAYPVGSIFMSALATNPSSQLGGGTWVAWGAGRVPVGVDTSQTEFSTVEETGGEKTHTLSIGEMPSHAHANTDDGVTTVTATLAAGGGSAADNGGQSIVQGATGGRFTKTLSESGNTGNAGGGGAHNNLQPYITCYMWKRTA